MELLTLFEASSNEMERDIKIETVESGDITQSSDIYESIEEDEKAPMREMFSPITPDSEVNDGGEIIVEYDWLEEPDAKPVAVQTSDQKKVVFKVKEVKVADQGNPAKAYQCEICLKTFKEKSKLKTHREIHTTERNVICPICHKAFKTQACLRSHRRVHNPTYMFCDICGNSRIFCYKFEPNLCFLYTNFRETLHSKA